MPKAGVGIDEFQSYIEFSRFPGRDQFDHRYYGFIAPNIPQDEVLTWFQRKAQFHQSAMRIHHDGLSLFREFGFVGQFPFHDHWDLKK